MAENFFGITDTGKVRDNNEDAFIAEKVFNKLIIACAIDGVGGYSGGEIAAEIARQSILENFNKPSNDLIAAMKASFIDANVKIFAEKLRSKDHGKMACVITLAVVDLESNQFHYAHVGDTRLYLLRDSSLVKVSKDHSFVGFLEDSGRLDESAAMSHLKRNEINKALGFGREIETQDDYIETGVSPFLPGDIILLCSDGLTDMVNKATITDILNSDTSLKEKGKQLIAQANNNGGKDNITAVLVKNDNESGWQPVAQTTGVKKKAEANPENLTSNTEKLEAPAVISQPVKSKNNRGLIITLIILCLVFLSAALFMFWKANKEEPAKEISIIPIQDTRNSREIKLQNLINGLKGDTLILSDSVYKEALVLSDTLLIPQDTLYIIANGNIIFKNDSTFNGPGIMLSQNSKLVAFQGIKFQDFNIAIASHNDALVLKNVRFINCKWPVQNLFSFPDSSSVSTHINTDSFQTDSITNIPAI